jgi:hypothetical protein
MSASSQAGFCCIDRGVDSRRVGSRNDLPVQMPLGASKTAKESGANTNPNDLDQDLSVRPDPETDGSTVTIPRTQVGCHRRLSIHNGKTPMKIDRSSGVGFFVATLIAFALGLQAGCQDQRAVPDGPRPLEVKGRAVFAGQNKEVRVVVC